MSVDYRLTIIGKKWNEESYSVKSDFWSNRFREIWDDLEQAETPKEIGPIFDEFLKTKEVGPDYIPDEKIITLSTLKAYIDEKKESLEKSQKKLADLREDRAKSKSTEAFENFTEWISSTEDLIRYYQEDCIEPVQYLIDGLRFHAYDVLDLTGDFYIVVQAWW